MERRNFPKKEFNNVRIMREQGQNWRQIAKHYNLSLAYVYKCFAKFFPKKRVDYSAVEYNDYVAKESLSHKKTIMIKGTMCVPANKKELDKKMMEFIKLNARKKIVKLGKPSKKPFVIALRSAVK